MKRSNAKWCAERSVPFTTYVFAAVLLVRLFALARLTASPFLLPSRGDMHFYNDWAQRICHGQWTDYHAFYGLPLYAYLLALLYKLFGYTPFVPGFLQAVLDGLTAVLLVQLSRALFGRSDRAKAAGDLSLWEWMEAHRGEVIGGLAALGWAFFVPAAAYSAILMPTAWFICAFWFVITQIVRRQKAGLVACFLLGALVGFTAMGIATILLLLPLVVLAIVFRFQHEGELPQRAQVRISSLAALLLGVALGTAPCWIHNFFVAHDPVILSAHSGVNFWIGNNPDSNGYPKFPPGLPAGQEAMLQQSISTAEAAAGHALKRSEVSAYWSTKANDYIRRHPGPWLRLLLVKTSNFWNSFQYDDLSIVTSLREQGVLLPGLRFGLVAALALPGLILAGWLFPLSRWVAVAIGLHMAAILPVFVTERYRLAVVPGLLVFAAFGLYFLTGFIIRENWRPAGGYILTVILTTWFVSRPQTNPSLWALDAYNSGWQALEARNLPLAERKLNLAYAYVPDNPEINFALGNLALEKGKPTQARAFYFATLNLDPDHAGAFNNLGVIAMDEQNWKAAARLFARFLSVNPRSAKGHYLLAKADAAQGDTDHARAEAIRALELQPTQPEFRALVDQLRP